MLRNQVGIKKMMSDGELGSFISHVWYNVLFCPWNSVDRESDEE